MEASELGVPEALVDLVHMSVDLVVLAFLSDKSVGRGEVKIPTCLLPDTECGAKTYSKLFRQPSWRGRRMVWGKQKQSIRNT
jgi:hypothetical protein